MALNGFQRKMARLRRIAADAIAGFPACPDFWAEAPAKEWLLKVRKTAEQLANPTGKIRLAIAETAKRHKCTPQQAVEMLARLSPWLVERAHQSIRAKNITGLLLFRDTPTAAQHGLYLAIREGIVTAPPKLPEPKFRRPAGSQHLPPCVAKGDGFYYTLSSIATVVGGGKTLQSLQTLGLLAGAVRGVRRELSRCREVSQAATPGRWKDALRAYLSRYDEPQEIARFLVPVGPGKVERRPMLVGG